MKTQKLYLPSHPLYLTLHPLHLCHQTQCISFITPTLCMTLHTICMTSHSVCMTSHEHFMTAHPYRYDMTCSIFMTYPICIDITHTVSWKQNDYTWHLTHCIWHHSHHTCSINAFNTIMEVFTLGSRMTPYKPYITSNSDFMTSIVSIKDITNTAFMTSDILYMTSHPWFMASHPLYMWHHSHYIGNITPTIFLNKYKLYLTWNTLC